MFAACQVGWQGQSDLKIDMNIFLVYFDKKDVPKWLLADLGVWKKYIEVVAKHHSEMQDIASASKYGTFNGWERTEDRLGFFSHSVVLYNLS